MQKEMERAAIEGSQEPALGGLAPERAGEALRKIGKLQESYRRQLDSTLELGISLALRAVAQKMGKTAINWELKALLGNMRDRAKAGKDPLEALARVAQTGCFEPRHPGWPAGERPGQEFLRACAELVAQMAEPEAGPPRPGSPAEAGIPKAPGPR